MSTSPYRKFVPAVLAIAQMSKDRSTKVGALALGPGREIRSAGYNGFPRGVNDDVEERHDRPLKLQVTAHAEENAVAQAARSGVSLEGCTLLVSTLYPCSTCARLIIQAGIRQVVALKVDSTRMERWADEWEVSKQMFAEAGVEFSEVTDG